MLNQKVKAKNGFTIIEVVLVLAIAGLIFLMVFVALPSLQSSQRDTQRRSDLSRLATAITQYQANNGGNLPSDKNFKDTYLGNNFVDPSTGSPYVIDKMEGYTEGSGAPKDGDGNPSLGVINMYTGAKCNGEEVTSTVGSRNYAIIINLENGVYCIDNS